MSGFMGNMPPMGDDAQRRLMLAQALMQRGSGQPPAGMVPAAPMAPAMPPAPAMTATAPQGPRPPMPPAGMPRR